MPAQIEFDRKDQTYIVRTYLSGTGMQTLADEFGVSVPVIRRVLVGRDVEIRPRGRQPQS
jgi:hypothetical protein